MLRICIIEVCVVLFVVDEEIPLERVHIGSDGAGNMSGRHKGFNALLKKVTPFSETQWCHIGQLVFFASTQYFAQDFV